MSEIEKLINSFEKNIPLIRKKYSLPDKYDQKEIKNLCVALKHRIELLNFLNDIIQHFDWNIQHKLEINDIPDEQLYIHERHMFKSKNMLINFNRKVRNESSNAMSNFIQISLMTMFSMVISIFGIIAELLWRSYNIEVKRQTDKGRIIIVKNERDIGGIKKITKIIGADNRFHENIRRILKENFSFEDYSWFDDIRNIRNECEHGDHTQIFVYSEEERLPSVTHNRQTTLIPFIHRRHFLSSDLPDIDKRRIDKYCDFIQEITNTVIRDFFKSVLSELETT